MWWEQPYSLDYICICPTVLAMVWKDYAFWLLVPCHLSLRERSIDFIDSVTSYLSNTISIRTVSSILNRLSIILKWISDNSPNVNALPFLTIWICTIPSSIQALFTFVGRGVQITASFSISAISLHFVSLLRVPSDFTRLRGTCAFDRSCCNIFYEYISLDFATTTNLRNSCRSAMTDKIVISFESFTETFFTAVANLLSFVLIIPSKNLTSFSISRFFNKVFHK